MKPLFFLLWLAGGGLVAIETYVCVNLLKLCEIRQSAYDEQLWEFLVNRGPVE